MNRIEANKGAQHKRGIRWFCESCASTARFDVVNIISSMRNEDEHFLKMTKPRGYICIWTAYCLTCSMRTRIPFIERFDIFFLMILSAVISKSFIVFIYFLCAALWTFLKFCSVFAFLFFFPVVLFAFTVQFGFVWRFYYYYSSIVPFRYSWTRLKTRNFCRNRTHIYSSSPSFQLVHPSY